MATPVYITGFECGCNPTTNGLGLWNSVNGSPVVDTTIKRTGAYSLKIVAPGAGQAYNCRKNIGASVQIAVSTFHFYVPSGGTPSANTIITGFTFGTYTGTAGLHLTSAGVVRAQVGSGSAVGSTNLVVDQWHRVDFRLNITTSTWTLEWYLDGVAQTNATWTGQSTTDNIVGHRFGSSSTTATYTIYFDDTVVSETSADFPLGNLAVEGLLPTSDGTHNAGTNVMEDQAGNDIGGAVTAYNKINSVPTNDTNYIRQAAIGTTNYAEVLFGNIQAGHSSILGAMALLAYSSGSTTANKGACVVSKDGFSTKTAVWGDTTATADYSDGTTAAPWWKSVIVAGVVDTTTVNALSARVGYSDDATPNPYWIDMSIEVAYVPSADIDLDLVTYSSTVNDLTVTENEIVLLDLVTYSSTINDIAVVENIPVDLDLVTYSSTINDLDVTENEIVVLDLVTYSSTFDDITILENEIVPLDLVSYSSTFDDLTVLENELVDLDLVTYSSTFDDLTVFENEIVILDLVTYSSTFDDVDLLEEGELALDLVEFSRIVYDVELVGDETTDLELVTYSSVVNDLTVTENEVELLDLVSYSSIYNPVTLDSEIVKVVSERVYAIKKESRIFAIDGYKRIFHIAKQDRTF